MSLALAGCASKPPLPDYGYVPPFTLTDQTGASFTSSSLEGRVWVADFFFTNCPGPCPRMSSQMHQVQSALAGQDVRLVSMTIDPDRDTPPVLAEYAKHFEAKPGVWYFLTGSRDTLNRLDHDAFKLGTLDGSLEHSTRFALVDRKQRIRGFYLTSEPDAIPTLIADARRLLRDVGQVANLRPIVNRPPRFSPIMTLNTLPALNAILNATAAILLIRGYLLIRAGRRESHRRTMIAAFGVSVAFLISYLTYHALAGAVYYQRTGLIRTVYLTILSTHTVLAATVPVLAIITLRRALKGNFVRHKAIAKWTFPIWLYVSVTGVVVYIMLYCT